MMRFVLLFLLVASFAVGQEGSPATSAKPRESARSSGTKTATKQVSNPAVITIKGVCASPEAKTAGAQKNAGAECKTVVTRAEFERLVDTLKVPPQAEKQFATQYATALIMANEAHKRGLDRGEHYEELLKLARLQVLTRQLAQSLQEDSAKIPDQEIENYYRNNKAAYEEATLDRLYIPRTQQQQTPPKEPLSAADAKKQQGDSEAAMKKEADDLRARAAAGEDFTKLEAEAYKFANFKATPPAVKMEKVRRASLPPSQASVLDMKTGEVSQVLTDPAGYFVYKLESKDTIPLDRVKDEIRSSLQKQKMQDDVQTMQQSAKPSFDEAYFASKSPAPPANSPQGMRGPHTPESEPSTGPK
ncbi:MAG: peptidylprolyl isomerase [Terriglobales bacterium]